jgi:AcrR family transcriptional regulator
MTVPQDRGQTGPRARRAERRQQLLTQARTLFATQGYAATTPAQIAEAAGLSEAVFFRYYPAKVDLFRDLLDDLLAGTLSVWRDETEELADPQARLLALGERYVASVRADAVTLRGIARALLEAEAEVQAEAEAFALAWEEFLAGLITQGQQTGVFRRSLDARVGAWQLMHAALGRVLTQSLRLALHERDDYASQAIQCAVHCLLKTDV